MDRKSSVGMEVSENFINEVVRSKGCGWGDVEPGGGGFRLVVGEGGGSFLAGGRRGRGEFCD